MHQFSSQFFVLAHSICFNLLFNWNVILKLKKIITQINHLICLDNTNTCSPMHVEKIHENNASLFLLILLLTCGWIGWKCTKTHKCHTIDRWIVRVLFSTVIKTHFSTILLPSSNPSFPNLKTQLSFNLNIKFDSLII